MARGAAKQKGKDTERTVARRPTGGRGEPAKVQHNLAVEDQMFFPRLRNHAKPVFVFLAVIFGAGFVFLGVGSGSSGLSDILDPGNLFGGGGSTTSLGSLKKKAEQHPAFARAQVDYAAALEADGQSDEAIRVLEDYVALRPKDTDVLSDLASRYENKAQDEITKSQLAQLDAANVSGSTLFPQLKLGEDGTESIGTDPVVDAVTFKAAERAQKAEQAAQEALKNDVRVLGSLAKLTPDDTIVVIRLADAAAQTGDNATAIKNYKAFLKLAPDDPQAPLAKQRLQQLTALSNAQGG